MIAIRSLGRGKGFAKSSCSRRTTATDMPKLTRHARAGRRVRVGALTKPSQATYEVLPKLLECQDSRCSPLALLGMVAPEHRQTRAAVERTLVERR